jgi:hypothetical protein
LATINNGPPLVVVVDVVSLQYLSGRDSSVSESDRPPVDYYMVSYFGFSFIKFKVYSIESSKTMG